MQRTADRSVKSDTGTTASEESDTARRDIQDATRKLDTISERLTTSEKRVETVQDRIGTSEKRIEVVQERNGNDQALITEGRNLVQQCLKLIQEKDKGTDEPTDNISRNDHTSNNSGVPSVKGNNNGK